VTATANVERLNHLLELVLDWCHGRVLQKMHAQILKTLQPVPENAILQFQTAGRRAEQVLLHVHAEPCKPWTLLLLARRLGLKLRWRPSLCRHGCAFATHFEMKQLRARSVCAFLEQLSNEGSFDPECKAMWARRIGNKGLLLRYAIFASTFLAIRDFFLISSLAKTEDRVVFAGLPGYARYALSDQGDLCCSGSAPAASSPWEQQLPPVSRNRTNDFQSLRGKQAEGSVEAQWRKLLRADLERNNPRDITRRRDAASAPKHSDLSKLACESCEKPSCGATVSSVLPMLVQGLWQPQGGCRPVAWWRQRRSSEPVLCSLAFRLLHRLPALYQHIAVAVGSILSRL